MSESILYVLIGVGVLIIAALGFYAGKLLHQLRQQQRKQEQTRMARIDTIVESVRTIAFAVEQQQCNLSEAAIRLVNLLHAIPVNPAIDAEKDFPALFALYIEVKDLPTHQERAALARKERMAQDRVREEHEARLESSILKEIQVLRSYAP